VVTISGLSLSTGDPAHDCDFEPTLGIGEEHPGNVAAHKADHCGRGYMQVIPEGVRNTIDFVQAELRKPGASKSAGKNSNKPRLEKGKMESVEEEDLRIDTNRHQTPAIPGRGNDV
jgi:hypothetical protein